MERIGGGSGGQHAEGADNSFERRPRACRIGRALAKSCVLDPDRKVFD